MPNYPFIILFIILIGIITIPPFVAAYIDMKREENNQNEFRKEDKNG